MKKKVQFKSIQDVDNWVMSDKRGTNEQFVKEETKQVSEPALRKLTVRIPADIYEKLRVNCFENKISITKEVEGILIRFLSSN